MSKTPIIVLDEHYSDPRKLRQAASILEDGGVIAYPTDSVYGIGCDLHNRKAIDRIYRIKHLDHGHRMSFICESISAVSTYGCVTDFAYRWLRRLLPGPYTVVLKASRMVPKVLLEKRREVGIRVPDNELCIELARLLGRPIISTSASDPATGELLVDADVIRDVLDGQLDMILDGGLLTSEPTTIVSLLDDEVEVLREGKGPTDLLIGG